MKLLIDMDIIVYHAALSSGGDTLSGVVDKLNDIMESILGATEVPCEYQGYLTGTDNFRHELSDIYKAHRPKDKPLYYKFARQYLIDNWGAIVVDGQEADDAIAIEATKNDPETTVVASIDKDMLQIPCWHFNFVKGDWTFVEPADGTKFFYKQILTGDAADNIKGLFRVGPVKADKLLEGLTEEKELYEAVVKAYDGDEGRVLENARLLWLRRYENQMWEPPND